MLKPQLMADVSSYQPDYLAFFEELKRQGCKAVVVKITEGTSYVNPKAKNQIANAKATGLKVHGYHFARFTNRDEAIWEGKYFAGEAKKLGLDAKSVMVLDFEHTEAPKNSTELANTFLAEVQAQGFPKVDVYCSSSVISRGQLKRSNLVPVNLWIASYGTDKPGLDNVGTWQFTDRGNVLGHYVDLSWDFLGFYTGKADVTKPSNCSGVKWIDELGDTWYKQSGVFILNDPINLRYGAKRTSKLIATLYPGDVVCYDAYSVHDDLLWLRQPREKGYGYLATGNVVNGERVSCWGQFSF